MNAQNAADSYILTLSCHDTVGIVAAISGHLAKIGGFIVNSQQYADLESGHFFLRIEFQPHGDHFPGSLDELTKGFEPIAQAYEMRWELRPSSHKPKLLIAVSKGSHCLNDLLYRWRTGNLPVEIVGVVSNHPDLRDLTEWHGVPYHHLPMTPETKEQQEAALLSLVENSGADYLILARYMQVLSPELVERLAGRCINIHHSFLPSFKGARPYARAHERGVKLIGATAHFVTSDLDEGPIIEQDVERVDHRATEQDLVVMGRDIEARVLARAVRWTAEQKVFLNGARTVVFR
ncbi:MAG: formyltetrahydrofolate deformylase [Citromicrobium sp.]|nr:formyltetrahydrofolate deformylase [Citromicrobium sp.]MAO95306.1 formyltetrahydrofolate deformylase [Citromicrobium sp.]MAS84899.1 formyltetrahydrofolate deformylase [Erythrobacteraceae bacterium]MBD76481.1 formyltetrahydrofolate deformylase [Citromicrobium sp.]MBT46915.1 formyltetrahydrofolate deformylase [Citromicrobium sp.]|tara:strand:- start:100 stop:975 length:876 start_codon:yes stop_codon:yes gene_type:complete